jgi:hypothetical protein
MERNVRGELDPRENQLIHHAHLLDPM